MVDQTLHDQSYWELRPDDERYPASVRDLEHPPKIIYGRGNPEILASMGLGVIGARRATPYGLAVASMAGRIAAESGITLVSGGAMGCDAAAARGALDAGGKTIVVSGVGADTIYPRTSRDVFERAVKQDGAVIALVPWGQTPRKGCFPQRNIIIAALSRALLICEAGLRSGTSSTAAAAADMGRETSYGLSSVFGKKFEQVSIGMRD